MKRKRDDAGEEGRKSELKKKKIQRRFKNPYTLYLDSRRVNKLTKLNVVSQPEPPVNRKYRKYPVHRISVVALALWVRSRPIGTVPASHGSGGLHSVVVIRLR